MKSLFKNEKQKNQKQEKEPQVTNENLTNRLTSMVSALPSYGHLPEEDRREIAQSLIAFSQAFYSIFQAQIQHSNGN